MKKFFGEFKTFITRGNVLDMAVGVIVGGAFTAIVNGLSNFVLKPLINWILALILGKNSLSDVYTFLGTPAYTVDAEGKQIIDLANSIYIDWGSLINAIINFFLIAFVLFTIVKIINKVKENNGTLSKKIKENTLNRAERKELKKAGVNVLDRKAVKEYFENKKQEELKAKEQAEKEAKEKAEQERLANPTTEDLLKQIKELLEKNIVK